MINDHEIRRKSICDNVVFIFLSAHLYSTNTRQIAMVLTAHARHSVSFA